MVFAELIEFEVYELRGAMYIIILNSLDNLGVKSIFFFFCSSECSAWSCLCMLVQLDLTADKMNLRGSKKAAEDGRPHSLTDNCRNRYTGLYANEKRGLYHTHTNSSNLSCVHCNWGLIIQWLPVMFIISFTFWYCDLTRLSG